MINYCNNNENNNDDSDNTKMIFMIIISLRFYVIFNKFNKKANNSIENKLNKTTIKNK